MPADRAMIDAELSAALVERLPRLPGEQAGQREALYEDAVAPAAIFRAVERSGARAPVS